MNFLIIISEFDFVNCCCLLLLYSPWRFFVALIRPCHCAICCRRSFFQHILQKNCKTVPPIFQQKWRLKWQAQTPFKWRSFWIRWRGNKYSFTFLLLKDISSSQCPYQKSLKVSGEEIGRLPHKERNGDRNGVMFTRINKNVTEGRLRWSNTRSTRVATSVA